MDDRLEFYQHPVDTDAFWPWLRRLILEKPAFVAQMTGIEQIGWLGDLKPPTPVPTFEALDAIWEERFKSSPEQKRKCLAALEDFRAVTGIISIKDITPAVVVAYRDKVYGRNLSGKSQMNRFTRLRRYLVILPRQSDCD